MNHSPGVRARVALFLSLGVTACSRNAELTRLDPDADGVTCEWWVSSYRLRMDSVLVATDSTRTCYRKRERSVDDARLGERNDELPGVSLGLELRDQLVGDVPRKK